MRLRIRNETFLIHYGKKIDCGREVFVMWLNDDGNSFYFNDVFGKIELKG